LGCTSNHEARLDFALTTNWKIDNYSQPVSVNGPGCYGKHQQHFVVSKLMCSKYQPIVSVQFYKHCGYRENKVSHTITFVPLVLHHYEFFTNGILFKQSS